MEAKKKSWTSALFAYAGGEKKRLAPSVVLSVLSVMLGLVPFYCMYALICLFVAGTATAALAVRWCLLALLAYAVKILLFSLSTGTSHAMAYTILDEATAFTDPENEDKIQRSIAALTRGKTLLVIAHRLSTIKNADNIVVLKNGAIVAQGTQEQLLEKCPLYQDMWRSHIGAKNWAVSTAAKEA